MFLLNNSLNLYLYLKNKIFIRLVNIESGSKIDKIFKNLKFNIKSIGVPRTNIPTPKIV